MPDGTTRELAEVRRIGIHGADGRPGAPDASSSRDHRQARAGARSSRSPPRTTPSRWQRFAFAHFLWNCVFITVVATLITLLFNSMAAFALSNYEFRASNAALLI